MTNEKSLYVCQLDSAGTVEMMLLIVVVVVLMRISEESILQNNAREYSKK